MLAAEKGFPPVSPDYSAQSLFGASKKSQQSIGLI
jgi:hypothetical protein